MKIYYPNGKVMICIDELLLMVVLFWGAFIYGNSFAKAGNSSTSAEPYY